MKLRRDIKGEVTVIIAPVTEGYKTDTSIEDDIIYYHKNLGLPLKEVVSMIAKERGFYSNDLIKKIARYGSIQYIRGIPDDVKKLFVTALDIKPEWHVKMQAAFQKYTDNAVSKTINLPHNASIEDVRKAYLLAYELKCKGITIYRYGSKSQQVLYIKPHEDVKAEPEFSGGCPYGECIT